MNGAPGLWRLWQAVAAALAGGRSYEQLLDTVPGPAAKAATAMLAEQLRAHDMLVEVPPGWGDAGGPAGPAEPPPRIAAWLAAVAADPVDAWERIRSAAVDVDGTGPVAAAAVRALTAAGVRVPPPAPRADRNARPHTAEPPAAVPVTSTPGAGPVGSGQAAVPPAAVPEASASGAVPVGSVPAAVPAGTVQALVPEACAPREVSVGSVPGDSPVGPGPAVVPSAVEIPGAVPEASAPGEAPTGFGGAAEPVVLAVGQVAVAAAARGEVGFVSPVGAPAAARRDAEMIGERIGLPAGMPPAVVVAALVGGAAAHRLVCVVAGLPDPGEDVLAAAPAPPWAHGRPTALVARLDPLTAEYHPWWQSADPADPADPNHTDTVSARVEALTDAETGALPALAVDDLPQVPAGLAGCDAGGAAVCGTGVDTAMARLSCAVGAAERLIALDRGAPVVVGADARHAEGVRLRRLLHTAVPRLKAADTAGTAEEWALSPGARRWFKAVTLRFGARADLRVVRLADGVFHAELHCGAELLGWAVEHSAADAAAYCALAAAGTLQWRAAGGDPAASVHAPCGALPVPAADAADPSPLRADAWIRPAGAAEREDALQREVRALLGVRAGSATPVAPGPGPGLLRALAVAGFAVLETAP
ncbi:hypothetical protein V2S66_28485 [Streptomyces sp. V4-01]|uniref:Uncharacterized protein n=1 Tax=Actinacidiphila polyblastidii TaxID=3110430 RepID=A0ABU7PJ96_9ACTN|nr:hypothetical protein [Streptomyces sp. V4-01]